MARCGGSFKADLQRFAKKTGATLDQAHRAICIELFTSVIMDTPVDQGTLRANWNVSTNKPDMKTGSATDPTGSLASGRVRGHSMKAGDRTYLTNAMPYAEVAEYGLWSGPTDKVTGSGFSRKAPAGMVRKNMARVESIVRRGVQSARRKAK